MRSALAGDGTVIAQVNDGVFQSPSPSAGANWIEVDAANVDCMTLNSDGKRLFLGMANGSIQQIQL